MVYNVRIHKAAMVLLAGAFMFAASSSQASSISITAQLPKGHCVKNIFGTKADDVLDGSDSKCDETIFGYKGNDILIGGRGKNILIGGPGQDTLTGGSKNFGTTFVFRRGSSDPEAPDAITDFADSGPFADYVVPAKSCEDTCTFIGTESFSGTAGEVRYEVIEKDEQTITDLSVDRNGDGAADFVADLLGSHSLTTANVLFR